MARPSPFTPEFRNQAAEGFLGVALAVSLLPLLFAGVAALLSALRLTDPQVAQQVIAKGLGLKVAQAAMFTAIISFVAAWVGDFPKLWSRAALALAISVASHFAVTYLI